MPNLNVCTGKAFGVGSSGELVIAGSGSKLWTLAGPIAANNGLNTDPVNGLWTAPHGCYSQFTRQQQTGLATLVNSSTNFVVPAVPFLWTNPSSAQQARVLVFAQTRIDASVSASTLLQAVASGNLGVGASGMSTPVLQMGNPTTGGAVNVTGTGMVTAEILVAPSGTATWTPSATVSWNGGTTGTVSQWFMDVAFLAFLLDPSQAGGIS